MLATEGSEPCARAERWAPCSARSVGALLGRRRKPYFIPIRIHRRTDESRLRVQDHRHRHLFEQRPHRAFVVEGLDERPVLKRRQEPRRDAAADEDAAGGHRGEREVAGRRPIGRKKERERLDALVARGREREGRDLGGAGRDVAGRIGGAAAAEMGEVRQVQQAASRQHVFEFGAAVEAAQVADEIDFALGAGGEVGMPPSLASGT